MVGGDAVLADGCAVFFRGVGYVAVPAVLRVLFCQVPHVFVTMGLRQDAGGGDGLYRSVSFDDGMRRGIVPGRKAIAVDQDQVGFDRQLVERTAHAFDRGVEDVDAVDFFGIVR